MSNATLKTCTSCKQDKPVDVFYAYKRSPDGKRSHCKDCMKSSNLEWKKRNPDKVRAANRDVTRNWIRRQGGNRAVHLKRKYGLTQQDFSRMLAAQNGVCKICKKRETKTDRTGKIQTLSVDHDHVTGKVRGLLCCNCNRMLGSAKDSTDTLRNAARYLEDVE